MFDINELKAKKVDELQVIAKNLNIKKISQQKKIELIYSILDHQADNSAMQKNENLKAAADTNANKKPSPKRENKNPDDVKAGKAQNQQQRKPMKAEEKKSSPKETTASEKNEPKKERKTEKDDSHKQNQHKTKNTKKQKTNKKQQQQHNQQKNQRRQQQIGRAHV